MKSSSLGARLFEGLVQPIFGSLWNNPPAAVKEIGDMSNIGNSRQAHVQPHVSSVQPASGYAEASAMRGSARQQGELSSVGDGGIHVGISNKNPSRRHPEPVPTRPLGSGNRLVNAAALSEVHTVFGGTPPTAQGRSRRKQRQTSCRLNEGAQGITKEASDASVATASHTRCVIRLRTDGVPGVPVCVLKSQRARQQKEDRRRKSTLPQASVIFCEQQQCAGGKPNAPSLDAQGSQGSTINAVFSQSAAQASAVANSTKSNALMLNNSGDGVINFCSGLNRIRSNNSGPGSICLTGGDDLRSYSKCNCGSDCSSSSSTWGSDEGVFAAGNSGLLLGEGSGSTDIHRNVQSWLTTRAQCRGQQLKEQQHRCLKQQPHQAQRECSTVKCAVSVEEGFCEARLHSWRSVAPSEGASLEKSCSGCSAPSSCRPQCSDTTTTCSSSSMTSCGDARDTATGSAATTSEHAQHYLDMEEQMPLAFPCTSAGDPSRTLCHEEAGELPCAQAHSCHVATQYSSSHDASSGTSSLTCVDPAANTSSSPPLSLAFASSASTTAASTQFGNRIFGITSLHSSSAPACAQQEETAAESGGHDTSNNLQADCMPFLRSRGRQQHYHLQSSAARVAPPKNSSLNVPVTEQHEDSATSRPVEEAGLADRDILYEQQEQQQSRQEPEVSTVGSVLFGHRVLKPLRSKSLEENYDALVEIVAFTKRRCERETMELLRKDVHILYYARGLHHAAHVETYLQQQQSQKGKHQHQGPSTAASENESANITSTSPSGGASLASGSAASQDSQPSSKVAAPAVAAHTAEKKSPATPCFPSVSAALASGARPRPVPDWATPEALRIAMERQQCYDPFSIFGEAPPELLLSEVYDEQHYTHVSPQTRASHPVLARLKQQRRAALMAVFQQKRAALARTEQLLEQELGKLQQQQCPSSQLQTPQEHETFSSILGRVVFSCGSVMQTAPIGGGATSKTDTSRKSGGSSSFLGLKSREGEGNPECKSIKDKETMLRLQQREVLVQQRLLERRLEDQLQQEERIYSGMLRNGFRFVGTKANGGECGAVLFRKRVLPALESWWQQQCQVELDWRNDPLTSEECSWYREVMNAAVDASDLISVQQACFCPTPPPYRQWTWTDCRVRQRKQHEQNLAKQRQEQLLQQLSMEGRHGLHRAIEWSDTGANAEQSDAEQRTTGQADRCLAGEEATGRVAADYDEHSMEGDTIGARLRGSDAEEIVEERSCDGESVSGSVEQKRNRQFLAGRTPSRRGRKRRAKEGDRTPQVVLENKMDAQASEREIAAANNNGSARKRPRSFCRQARKIQFYHAQAERSQNLQNVGTCSGGRGCACSSRLHKEDNSSKQRWCPNSVAKANTLFSDSTSVSTAAADKSSHASNAQSSGAEATTLWPQPLSDLTERRGSVINSSGAAAITGTCNVASKGNGRSGISPRRARLGCHALSTPVAKVQAFKLSKQRYLSTAPLQHAQQRDKAIERDQQQQLQCSHFAPSNKATGLRRETSPHRQAFVSPNVIAARRTARGHLISIWKGNGRTAAAARSAWDVETGTAETVGVAAAAGGIDSCGGGTGGAEHGNITARGLSVEVSSASVESQCRPGRTMKQLRMNVSQRLPRQLQKHVLRSARPPQEGYLSTCNTGFTGHSVSATGTHSGLAIAGVGEVTEGRPVLTEPANTRFTGKSICNRENSTSRSLYFPSRSNMRPTTLLAACGARLSIDRVYGCRRTSDFFHSRRRSQFVLGSLVRPDITSAIRSADDGIAADDVCKKDIECMNNEVP